MKTAELKPAAQAAHSPLVEYQECKKPMCSTGCMIPQDCPENRRVASAPASDATAGGDYPMTPAHLANWLRVIHDAPFSARLAAIEKVIASAVEAATKGMVSIDQLRRAERAEAALGICKDLCGREKLKADLAAMTAERDAAREQYMAENQAYRNLKCGELGLNKQLTTANTLVDSLIAQFRAELLARDANLAAMTKERDLMRGEHVDLQKCENELRAQTAIVEKLRGELQRALDEAEQIESSERFGGNPVKLREATIARAAIQGVVLTALALTANPTTAPKSP